MDSEQFRVMFELNAVLSFHYGMNGDEQFFFIIYSIYCSIWIDIHFWRDMLTNIWSYQSSFVAWPLTPFQCHRCSVKPSNTDVKKIYNGTEWEKRERETKSVRNIATKWNEAFWFLNTSIIIFQIDLCSAYYRLLCRRMFRSGGQSWKNHTFLIVYACLSFPKIISLSSCSLINCSSDQQCLCRYAWHVPSVSWICINISMGLLKKEQHT